MTSSIPVYYICLFRPTSVNVFCHDKPTQAPPSNPLDVVYGEVPICTYTLCHVDCDWSLPGYSTSLLIPARPSRIERLLQFKQMLSSRQGGIFFSFSSALITFFSPFPCQFLFCSNLFLSYCHSLSPLAAPVFLLWGSSHTHGHYAELAFNAWPASSS